MGECKYLKSITALTVGVLFGYLSCYSREAWFQTRLKVDPRTILLDKINREADSTITQKIFDRIDTKELDKTLRKLTSVPHLAGTKNNKDAGYYVNRQFTKYGLESKVVEYNVTLSYPDKTDDNYVAVIERDGTQVFRTKVNISGDEVPPYNAYSPSGRVEGNLVFVNYGRSSDFELLKKRGINCTGQIVIAKYGSIFRGKKVKNAFEAGATGIILYSDPADYATYRDVSGTYPDSSYLPEDGVQRGTISLINQGDLSTPGYPANEYIQRLTDEELKQRLPQIPCLPISYRNAYNILRQMSGYIVPASWRGGLNITYKTGPLLTNSRKIILNVRNRLEKRKIYNVIGQIKGDIEPDRYVIIGNHRDAWVYGSSDPTSGSVVLLEIARVFGHLYQEGWRPHRTILICSWDAEEFGLLGSYEYVEDNIKWLYPNAVAYLNVDTAVSGNETINLRTVPLLQSVFEKAADKVPDPHNRFDSVYQHLKNNRYYIADRRAGGSDEVAFLTLAGIPYLYSSFVKVWHSSYATPLYHSRYEDYHAYKMIDPEMQFSKTMTSIFAEMTRNLADSRIIPFDVLNYANNIRTATKAFIDVNEKYFPRTSIEYLQKSVNAFYESSTEFMRILKSANSDNPLLIRSLNDRLILVERSFLIDEGLPGQWGFYKHVLYSPGTTDYYTGDVFPGLGDVRQCYTSERKMSCLPKINRHLTAIIHCIYSAARVLHQ